MATQNEKKKIREYCLFTIDAILRTNEDAEASIKIFKELIDIKRDDLLLKANRYSNRQQPF